MPEKDVQIRFGSNPADPPGTPLVVVLGAMFGFAPPPAPQTVPTPCPGCHSSEAVSLYATARTEYFRCVRCQTVWPVTRGDHAPHVAAA